VATITAIIEVFLYLAPSKTWRKEQEIGDIENNVKLPTP
jgi:hypothetical protein